MDGIARNSNWQDQHGHDEIPQITCASGTVGWKGQAEIVEFGALDNDGRTLVRVTLHHGRDPYVASQPGEAAGLEVLAQVGWPFFIVPPRGAGVVVAFPDGNIQGQGAGCIVFVYGKSPLKRFEENRVNLNFGDKHVVIEGKSVTLKDENKFAISIGAGPKGGDPAIYFFTPAGTGGSIGNEAIGLWVASGGTATSRMQLAVNSADLMVKDGGFINIEGEDATLMAQGVAHVLGASTFLGPAPTTIPPTNALYGPTGMAGTASTSVFISP